MGYNHNHKSLLKEGRLKKIMEQHINPEHAKGNESTRTMDASKPKNPIKGIKLFALLIISIALVAGGYLGYKYYHSGQNSSQKSKTLIGTSEAQYKNDMLGTDGTAVTTEYLVEKYSQAYGVSLQNTTNTNPSTWDKAKVDDAYTTLLYVNKVGSFAQTLQYLALLEGAKAGGVNIDNNSYAINQKTRDEIYKSAMQQSAKPAEQRDVVN